MTTVILINSDAVKVEELFLDEEWFLEKLFDNIYTIIISQKKLNWLEKLLPVTVQPEIVLDDFVPACTR